ncbi:MAG TPA: hypothetical protein VMX17_06340 [Candidatus Glassbacteria bacterium]|nr:hypothetical protein [Candidatus Glassbacteria bacterium]
MVTKEEFKELMKDKLEEISREEFMLNDINNGKFFCSDESFFFKFKEQWPKVFKDEKGCIIKVYENGGINIVDRDYFNDSIPTLKEAIRCSDLQKLKINLTSSQV